MQKKILNTSLIIFISIFTFVSSLGSYPSFAEEVPIDPQVPESVVQEETGPVLSPDLAYVQFEQDEYNVPIKITDKSNGEGNEYLPNAEGDFAGYYELPKGIYSVSINTTGMYRTVKAFNISKSKLGKTSTIKVHVSKMAGNGYEPTKRIYLLTDTINKKAFSASKLKGFTQFDVPSLAEGKGEHQFATNEEVYEYAKACCDKSEYLTCFKSEFGTPIVTFSSKDVSGAKDAFEAAQMLRSTKKVNIFYQGQIHGDEPGGCEGALAIINKLSKKYGKSIVGKVNILIIPRLNYQGAQTYTREFDKIDPNRDSLIPHVPIIEFAQKLFYAFRPDVAIDAHEYGDKDSRHLTSTGSISLADIEVSTSGIYNYDKNVRNLAFKTVNNTFKSIDKVGLSYDEYTTYSLLTSRSYYAMHNCISILLESRGYRGGKTNYARRIYSQYVAAKSIIDYSYKYKATIKKTIKKARDKMIADMKVYGQGAKYVLKSKNVNTIPVKIPRTKYYASGKVKKTSHTIYRGMKTLRKRAFPTAYVIPKNAVGIEKVLKTLDNKSIEYFEIPATAEFMVEGYLLPEGSKECELEGKVISLPYGAYVIPTSQFQAFLIASIFEPDIAGTASDTGSFVQQSILSVNDVYRYTLDVSALQTK